MRTKTTFFFAAVLLFIFSCADNSPKSVFGKTVLNTNYYINFGKREINSMKQSKERNLLMGADGKALDSYTTYVESTLLAIINSNIEKVTSLQKNDKNAALIEKSLAAYTIVKSAYEDDYMNIAKMMDEGAPQAEIDSAIETLENEKVTEFIAKKEELFEAAKVYAADNGIDFKVQ